MAQRVQVLGGILNGNSIRGVSRMTGIHPDTINRFELKLGQACERLHNRLVREVKSVRVQVDEIWSYVGKKQHRVTAADPPGIGEAYTFVGLDALSRLVISWRVGRRDAATTRAFINDLRARLATMPQITSDGFTPYIATIAEAFGMAVDYMQTVKHYKGGGRGRRDDDYRYEPPRDPFITKVTVYGAPDPKHASTAYVERQNGTTRHTNGRLRRLCYAFSKKLENHCAAVALNSVAYNLCHVVRTLRVTPAMQAGITDHVWTPEELICVAMTEPAAEPPERGPLTPRTPEVPARALPEGRGFLRLVKTEPGLVSPSSPSEPRSKTLARPTLKPVPQAPVQLRMFDLKPKLPEQTEPSDPPPKPRKPSKLPKPQEPEQLSMFDD